MVFDLWHPVGRSLHEMERVDWVRRVRLGVGDTVVVVVDVDVGAGNVIVDALEVAVDKLLGLVVVVAVRGSWEYNHRSNCSLNDDVFLLDKLLLGGQHSTAVAFALRAHEFHSTCFALVKIR